jgi:hypothetical protein
MNHYFLARVASEHKLLVETGTSFSRPSDVDVAAEDGDSSVCRSPTTLGAGQSSCRSLSVEVTLKRGDIVTAAAHAA